jgi:hypothetical protein
MTLPRPGWTAAAALALATLPAVAGVQTAASAAQQPVSQLAGTGATAKTGKDTSGKGDDTASGGATAPETSTPDKKPVKKPATVQEDEPGDATRETTPLPTETGTETESATPAADAERGESSVGRVTEGAVRVKLPGASGYSELPAGALPLGARIDATNGTVALTTALPGGTTQTATFWGGVFTLSQDARTGIVDIKLAPVDRTGCPTTGDDPAVASAASASGSAKRRLRSLWVKDRHGRFRTSGRYSVATVRGTEWVTRERCDGTFTYVRKGAVDVLDRRTGRVHRVRAGHGYLARR